MKSYYFFRLSRSILIATLFSTLVVTLFLTGCVGQRMQVVPAELLPPVDDATININPPSPLTQAALLEQAPLDERAALTPFLQTHEARVLETSQHIQFPFGRITPRIHCSPLHACDIALQWGESVTGVYPGDSARWLFEEAVSDSEIRHIIFKPRAFDIETNVIITTNRRTYHIELESTKEGKDLSVKSVSFYYPDDFLRLWQNAQQESKQTASDQSISEFHDLDFHYTIDKSFLQDCPTWMPLRVFNNGKQVYIQMPASSTTTPLPVLFVVGEDQKPILVNYRIRKPYYIVDQLFQKAVLSSGVGESQQRITITYHL